MDLEVKYSARFRDAKFYFSGSASTSGGRKTITREFPGSDRRYVEDMGLLNKTFELEGIVTTEQEKEKLIAALETAGIGQLSHPTFGLIDVVAKPYTVVDSIQTLGYCTFTMSFEVAQENIYPVANSNNISYLQEKTSFLDNSILAGFAEKVGISPETLQTAITTATEVVNKVQEAVAFVDEVKNEVIAFKEGIVELIQAPIDFINGVKSVVDSVVTFLEDPLAAFDILTGMFSFGDSSSSSGGFSSVPLTAREIEKKRVSDTIVQAVNTVVISKAYDVVSTAEFENNIQLESTKEQLEELYENLIENPTDFLIEPISEEEPSSILENLQEVRQLSNNILLEKENTVARVVEVNTYDTTLNDFVYTYYGNLDNLDKIDSMNDIEDRSSVSGTLKVLSE